tara:strand:- start:865 stop:1200 length:336 start_codon:yes stop_codon:yes gene_type:complete
MLKFHQALHDAFSDFKETGDTTTEAAKGFIKVEYEDVTFTMQSGDVSDFGENGVQCDEMLMYVESYLKILNSHVKSPYNEKALKGIAIAISALKNRTENRIARGVESTHNV